MNSLRIKTIVDKLKPRSVVIDVGSDHAALAIDAINNKKCKLVYNIELNQKPLDNTINNLKKVNLLNKTINIRDDGLKTKLINHTIDTCVIAGMGGLNMIKILNNKNPRIKIKKYILVPNNNPTRLRDWLESHQYNIIQEESIQENNYYYQLMIITNTKEQNDY